MELEQQSQTQLFGFTPPISALSKPQFSTEPQAGKGLILDASGRLPRGLGAGATTGDYKISAQTATHSATDGGTWYLCDGSAVPATETDLIALIGANFPDAPGRALVMVGTHSDVNAIGDSDGLSAANRRPKHNTTLTDTGHAHDSAGSSDNADYDGSQVCVVLGNNNLGDSGIMRTQTTGITANAAGGSGGSDQPAFIVPGSLFIHS